jgi:hypothetical protein
MDYQILEILNKKKFSSSEVLNLIISRVIKIVLLCLCLTFLFWFFLIQNYLLFALLLGIFWGGIVEGIINSRKNRLKVIPEEKAEYFTEKKVEV